MSVALHVRLSRSLALSEIETVSSAALRELLNLEHEPVVSARFDESDRVGNDTIQLLADGSNRIVCSLLGHEEQVTVTPFTIPVQLPSSDGSYSFSDQVYVSVKWHFRKTPLCWALIAAVAVGIAKKQESEIEDSAGFFTDTNDQAPEEFCRTLRLPTLQADVELAAAALYEKMPKSAELTEWLKQQPKK